VHVKDFDVDRETTFIPRRNYERGAPICFRGKTAPIRTCQDLLKTSHDEALFEYYATSQMALVDAATGRRQNVGEPGLFNSVKPAPGGEYFLVSIIQKPFSRLREAEGFPAGR